MAAAYVPSSRIKQHRLMFLQIRIGPATARAQTRQFTSPQPPMMGPPMGAPGMMPPQQQQQPQQYGIPYQAMQMKNQHEVRGPYIPPSMTMKYAPTQQPAYAPSVQKVSASLM